MPLAHAREAVLPNFTLRDYNFGFTSSQEESLSQPNLLLKGFLDVGNVTRELLNGSKFLILGYKGSGKSAINEHLRLSARNNPHLFVTSLYLQNLPYDSFQKIMKWDPTPESRIPSAWSWILLLTLFGSFSQDMSAPTIHDTRQEFERAFSALKEMGCLPMLELGRLVLLSSRHWFTPKMPFSEPLVDKHATGQERLTMLVDHLKALALKFRANSTHLLIIDGFDDILSMRTVQHQTLAGLIFESSRLNSLFRQHSVPAKIVVLCRTDLYERLPGPNKNKIRQDSAVVLDWYRDPSNPADSDLIKLINLKAKVSNPTIKDVFGAYFPSQVPFGGSRKEIRAYLLEHTRHTPRDFIKLLAYIQQFSGEDVLDAKRIDRGLRKYSIDYFLPEIKDEAVGYEPAEDVDTLLSLIAGVGKQEFTVYDVERAGKRRTTIDVPGILDALYECGALGNVRTEVEFAQHYSFKYRNRNSRLNLSSPMVLHRALWKALNLRFARGDQW